MRNKLIPVISLFMVASITFIACSDEQKDVIAPYAEDITFSEQPIGRFAFNIPDAPFKAGDAATGTVTVNVKKNTDGTYSGFAVSNKNWRSYPWSLSPDFAPSTLTAVQRKSAIDSTVFSVYTLKPNLTETFLVACVKDNNAFITLDKPAVIEHILVANTTYNFLLESYGSNYSGTLDAVTQQYLLSGTTIKNIQMVNTATTTFGRFYLPGPTGTNSVRLAGDEILSKMAAGRAAANAARLAAKTETQAKADSVAAYTALVKGYVKLTVKGYNGESATSKVDYWLAIRPGVDAANPALDIVRSDWNKVDLTALGTVTKIAFELSSSYVDGSGNPLTAPYFCLDGIRIRK